VLIQRLEAKNYRSLLSVDLDLHRSGSEGESALVALLGRNGGGKSSILYALDVFCDIAAKVTRGDFFAHDLDNEIEIRLTYGTIILLPEGLIARCVFMAPDAVKANQGLSEEPTGAFAQAAGSCQDSSKTALLDFRIGTKPRVCLAFRLVED
jgi:hypothetical protein